MIIYYIKKLFSFIPDKLYLHIRYFKFYKKIPNTKNGKTFDEKILTYMLYYRQDDMPIMADKYRIREYIANKGYAHILNELYGVYNSFDEIDFDSLPKQFVLKANHGCGYNLIIRDKSLIDFASSKKIFDQWMKENFYNYNREWVYKNIKRKIICEKYLENDTKGNLLDYKLFCFHGEVKFTAVCSERRSLDGLKVDYYDIDWKTAGFSKKYTTSNTLFEKPNCYQEMIKTAEILSKVVPFMRVDFYIVNDKLILGELSFFPDAGLSPCEPDSYNYILGGWLHLDEFFK